MNLLALEYRVVDLRGMLLFPVADHQVDAIVNEVLKDLEIRHLRVHLLQLFFPQEKDLNLRDRFEVGDHRHLYY